MLGRMEAALNISETSFCLVVVLADFGAALLVFTDLVGYYLLDRQLLLDALSRGFGLGLGLWLFFLDSRGGRSLALSHEFLLRCRLLFLQFVLHSVGFDSPSVCACASASASVGKCGCFRILRFRRALGFVPLPLGKKIA